MEENKPKTGITIDTETINLDGKSKIVIVGSGAGDDNAALIEAIKNKFGDDLIIVDDEKELKGLTLKQDDLSNIKETFLIKAQPPLAAYGPISSGKDNRRKRREQARKNNKLKY